MSSAECPMATVRFSSEASPLRPLPFAFAKRHGVLLREPFGQAQLQVRRGASLTAVQEAQRFAGRVLPLEWLEAEVFEQQLSLAYQRDSSEVRQMAEGLGAEMDLASLAELTPESGDLLEQEDDAPIIRLINAILSEAIKAGASDIHLETFEKRLVVRFRVDGILREVIEPRRELAALLVSRVKVMARLDIAEKSACRRTGVSRSRSAVARSISAYPHCHRPTASGWCCVCWINKPGACPCSTWV